MNPDVGTILRTLKASLEEHVIPELDSKFARGQAGQVAVTLEWLAEGLEEPVQKLREGNAELSDALETLSVELQRLTSDDATQSDRWQASAESLQAALNAESHDSLAGQLEQRDTYFKVLDDLVIAAGVPQGGADDTGPLWIALQRALEALAVAEQYMGSVPLPQEHWR